MVVASEEAEPQGETVWATPTQTLVPDVFWIQGEYCPMWGGYEHGERVSVDIEKSPFFKPGRRLDDLDAWQRKLEGMSYWLEINEPQVEELKMREEIEGKSLGYQEARTAFTQEATISNAQTDELTSFALCSDNPMGMRRWARAIANKTISERSQQRELNLVPIRQQWKDVRRDLQLGDIHGEYALRKQLESESDEDARKVLYNALHAQDSRLAELMIEKRNRLIQRTEYELSYEQKKLGFMGFGVGDINFSQLNQWIGALYRPIMKARSQLRRQLAGTHDYRQPWNRPYWDNQVNKFLHKDQLTIRFDEDILWRVALAWKLDVYYDLIQCVYSKRGEMAYCPHPPEQVVATYGDGKTFIDTRNKWHELGHAWQSGNVDDTIAYPLRFADPVWNESNGIDMQNVVYDPSMLAVMGIVDVNPVILEGQRLLDVMEVVAACAWRLEWEHWFYDAQSRVDIQNASQYYESCLDQVGGTPDSPMGWANDLYLFDFEWYGINYLGANFVVEGKRKHTQEQYGGPFTPEAMWWKHQKCWWPGGALGWRDLFQHATGKPFSQEPLMEAVNAVDLPGFIHAAASPFKGGTLQGAS